jgi:tryptophan synthase alpha subunit
VATLADAVVVGSALVDAFHRHGKDAALTFLKGLSSALIRK